MSRGAVTHVAGGQLCDAAFPPDGWWLDFPACGRYLSTPTNNSKNLKQWEIDRGADLGHGFLLFAEQAETTPINSTLDDDVRLAEQAAQMAEDFDAPAAAPLWFAVDTDGRPYMDQVRAAFVTYRQRVPADRPLMAYAGSDVIDQLVDDGTIVGGHIPAALSWSSTSRPVDGVTVFQTPGGLRWYRSPSAVMVQRPSEAYRGGRIDRNDIVPGQSVPVWFPGASLEPQEADMDFFIYQCSDADAAFLGLSTPSGIVPWVEWLSGSRKAQYKADGLVEKGTTVAGVKNCTLIGALPQADSRHSWTAADFAQTSTVGPQGPAGPQGAPGPVGPQGPPGPSPKTVTFGY